jgi:glucose/arabinose dehydrogenase
MGHFGAHYDEPALLAHIVGGVQWAAGVAAGDCGGTRPDSFEKVALDENTSAPYALDVAPDGRVFFTELVRGQIRVWDPRTGNVSTAITIPVYSGGEDGLLGIALSPDFASNGHLFVYYSPNAPNNADPASFKSRISRFTVTPGTSAIDPASEKLIIEVPARREPDEPGHTGGGLDFDREGNLLLAVGDDVNPHSEPSGGYAPLSERPGTFHDARATSANTNDLRGKLLRITPGADGGYTVPAGNLFPEAADTADKTRPEIYAMGLRNPFRFSVDPNTGWIALADYAPDSGQERPADRGPAGIVEWNLIKSPGNYGWPLCMGNNEPFRDVEYRTSPVTVGRVLRLRESGQRLDPQHRADQPAAFPGAGDVVRLHEVLRAGGHSRRGRSRADGRAVLRLRPDLDVRRQVPGVLRRQGLLLRMGQELDLLDGARRLGQAREDQPVPSEPSSSAPRWT